MPENQTFDRMTVPAKRLNTMSKALVFALALMVIALSPALAQAGSCPKAGPKGVHWQPSEAAEAFPDAPFYTGNGDEKRIQDYQGLGVVMNFWATWCAPCVREMPSLNSLQKDQGEPMKLAVLPISLDRGGARQADPFYKTNNLDALPVLIDNKRQMSRGLGIKALPMTILIGRDGRELGRILGEADWHGPEMVGFLKACFGPA